MVEDELERSMYARQPKTRTMTSETRGRPSRSTYMRKRGAWPYPASAVSVRLVAKVAEFPTDRTEMRITALKMEGRAVRADGKIRHLSHCCSRGERLNKETHL
jgi:hypothetical protein